MKSLSLLGVVAATCAAAACSYDGPGTYTPVDAGGDAMDGPPPVTEVRFMSVTANMTSVRPGRYGIEITAVLRNGLDVEITDLRPTLSFLEGTADRAADFRWRDADARDRVTEPQPSRIGPGGEATLRFRVDALASAAPRAAGVPLLLNGAAVFQRGAQAFSATPLEAPLRVPFEDIPAPIVVTSAVDDNDSAAPISLRNALELAGQNPGFDRIVFDPAAFPPGAPATIQLQNALGPLPTISQDLVIDGTGAGVIIATDATWQDRSHYGLRLANDTLVVHGLGFRDLGHNYPLQDVSVNNCGDSSQRDGGAIRVDTGTLILDGNVFADPGVAERNCYAASVRIHGGLDHRILRNRWTDPTMDALYVNSPLIEITDNFIHAGASANPDKTDDCMYLDAQSAGDIWIVGNLCVDQEFSGIVVGGTTGTVHIAHNTFVRNRRGHAVRRIDTRPLRLHNNAYHSNAPAGVGPMNNGTGVELSHESSFGGVFCEMCSMAAIQTQTITDGMDLRFANPLGATPAALTPLAGSLLVDSGHDLFDRNGSTPRRFNGAGPERGAFELP